MFLNNSVKVVSNAFDFEKDECEDERAVRRNNITEKIIQLYFL